MADQPASRSRAGSGDETSTSLRSSTSTTSKRPVTKPVLSTRLSALSRPTSTSAAKSSTTSTLSKPPSRPTLSNARRSTTTAPTATGSLHKSQPSMSSVEGKASGDESKRDGISAKPKRMSSVSKVSTERPTLAATRTTSSTSTPRISTTTAPTKNSMNSPTAARPSVRSTPSGLKTSLTSSTTRTPVTTASRTKPPSSSVRSGTVTGDNKRLSTIPASPAVKGPNSDDGEGKASDMISESEKSESVRRVTRPVLGTRKSTSSVLMEQRVHEFELVSQMLRAAMSSDGVDEEEKAAIDQEAADTMSKLRLDLARARAFEREHGRLPSEAELADVNDSAIESVGKIVGESDVVLGSSEQAEVTRQDLLESQAQVESLQAQLVDLTATLHGFSRSTEEEAAKVSASLDAIRREHTAEIEKMVNLHQANMNELRQTHNEEKEALSLTREKELTESSGKDDQINTLQKEIERFQAMSDDLAKREDELSSLRAELVNLRSKSEASVQKDEKIAMLEAEVDSLKVRVNSKAPGPASSEASPSKSEPALAAVQKEFDAFKARHRAAKENAKSKAAKLEDDHASRISELESQHKMQNDELKHQVEEARTAANEKQAELNTLRKMHDQELANLSSEISSQSEKMQKLRDEVLNSRQAKLDVTKHLQVINSLQKENESLQLSRAEDAKASADGLIAMKEEYSKELETTQAKIKDLEQELLTLATTKDRDVSLVAEKVQAELEMVRHELATTKTSHEELMGGLQMQLETTQKEAEATKDNYNEQLQKLGEDTDLLIKSQDGIKTEHAGQLQALRYTLQTSRDEVEALKSKHARDLAETEANKAKAHTEALRELEIVHADSLRQYEEQSTNHDRSTSALKTELASLKEQLTEVSKTHVEEMSALKAMHASEKEISLKELDAEHSKKLLEVEHQLKDASEEAVQNLKAVHNERVQHLQTQVNNVTAEVSSARFQVQTIKSILKDTEDESRAKEEELNEKIEKIEAQFSQAIMKHADYASQLAIKDSQHATEMGALQKKISNEHNENIEQMQTSHGKALAELQLRLETQAQESKHTLISEHDKALSDVRQEIEMQKAGLEKLRNEHAVALDEAVKAAKADHDDAVTGLKLEHSQTIAASLENLKSEHQSAITELQQELEKMKNDHDTTVEKMKTEHESTISNLEIAMADLQVMSNDTSAVEAAQTELAKANTKMIAMQEQHETVLSATEERFARTLALLQMELEDAKAIANQAAESDKEMKEIKNLLSEATTTITSLKDQLQQAKITTSQLNQEYANAALDAETQRKLAVAAQRQLDELEKSHITASASTSTSTSPVERAKPDAIRRNSTRSGLESSKWAVKEDEAARPKTPEDFMMSPAPLQTGFDRETSPTEHDLAAVSKPASSKRNIPGQLAGIQEHINQLNDIDQELLAGNQRMARTLIRVDDFTTSSVGSPTEEPSSISRLVQRQFRKLTQPIGTT